MGLIHVETKNYNESFMMGCLREIDDFYHHVFTKKYLVLKHNKL